MQQKNAYNVTVSKNHALTRHITHVHLFVKLERKNIFIVQHVLHFLLNVQPTLSPFTK